MFVALIQSVSFYLLMAADAATDIAREDTARLEACLEKVETSPADAYEDGLTWLSEGSRPEARHCTALALLALGHADEAAARLEALANAPDAGGIEERAIYLSKAGNAWLLARRPEAAKVTLTNALKLNPNDADLLMDRARANLLLGNWAAGETDLNAALGQYPSDVDALKLRAQARLNGGDRQGASDDVNLALGLAPNDLDLLVLRGEVREAQRLAGER